MILGPLANIVNSIAVHPLTRERRLRALGRFVHWQLRSRVKREVTVPWIEGAYLSVSRGMTGATGNIYCGLHEFEDMAFLLHFLRPGDLFVDVGANVGSYTILASAVCGARAIAFEPDPRAFEALHRNIALNRVGNLADARQSAVGSRSGIVDFTIGLDTTNRVAIGATGPSRVVVLETLDRELGETLPSLIKMDVEGFEAEVLGGAGATLQCPELKAVITEDRSPLVVNTLRTAEFAEYSYDPFTRNLTTGEPRGQRQNALFVRDHEFVQRRLSSARQFRVLDRLL